MTPLRLRQMLSGRPRFIRITILLAIALAVEGGLLLVRWEAPATGGLMRPLYWIVAVLFVVAVGQAARPRAGKDRRRTDRRD